MKFLVVNDPHISARTPESRSDDYSVAMLKKLKEIVDLANSNKVEALFFTGDFFHYKDPVRTPHRLIISVMDILTELKHPAYCTLGNHDLEGGSLESIVEQPLGVLLASGHLKNVEQVIFPNGSRPVQVTFHPYEYGKPDSFLTRIETQQRNSNSIYVEVVHAGIIPVGSMQFDDTIFLDNIWGRGRWDIVCSGHIHNDMGVVRNSSGRYFCNVGAISRGTIAESNLSRMPKVLLLKVTEGGIVDTTTILLQSALPAAEVFRIKEHAEKKGSEAKFDSFVNYVSTTMNTAQAKTIELIIEEFFEKKGISAELRTEIRGYLARAS